MNSDPKPLRIKAKITRTVVETAYVLLNRDGSVEEVLETDELLDYDNVEIENVMHVVSYHD